jgi:hypothetical protein
MSAPTPDARRPMPGFHSATFTIPVTMMFAIAIGISTF